ncbi:MAG: tetratricopeptide repeat protein [Candidatus Eisenbacteria bacterium]
MCSGWAHCRAELRTLTTAAPLGGRLLSRRRSRLRSDPDRIGSYAVLGEVGRGGMGIVYRALDPRLQRRLRSSGSARGRGQDPAWSERFLTSEGCSSISHPNIATVFSLEDTGDQTFLTMELVRGESLADRTSRGPLSLDDALAVGQQICSAVEAAHDKKVLHLDLKPLNVMITETDAVKVLDFGLARSVSGAGDGITSALRAGTPGYMSPEQIESGEVGMETDVWGLGCLFYECLSGRPAFPGETALDRLKRSLSMEPDFGGLPDELPSALRTLLRSCFARPRTDRLASVRTLRRAIEEEIAGRARVAAVGRLGAVPTPGVADPSQRAELPAALTRFVGRAADIDSIAALLGEHRLVSMVGPGGAGKSRLSVESARRVLSRFPHGACFAEFAPVTDPRSTASVLLALLGGRDASGRAPLAGIHEFLRGREFLLILDNCEHLVTAIAPLVEQLLVEHPKLVVLATSREALGVPGEWIYRVPPMEESAVELFIDRAMAARPGFEADEATLEVIRTICRRLDGLPLAVELAAARTRMLRPEEILERLDDRFRLLGSGSNTSLPRHRTLKALIDWSYEQLEEREQMFFQRLSVFSGGFTLEAAESVATGDGIEAWEALDLLGRLVEKSLVEMMATADPGGRARYRMLDTVHEYGRRALGLRSSAEVAHRRYFAELAETYNTEFTGRDLPTTLDRVEADLANFRKAIESGLDENPPAKEIVPIAIMLLGFGNMRGRWAETRQIGEAVISRFEFDDPMCEARGHLCHRIGNLANAQGDTATTMQYFDEASAIWDHLGIHRNRAAILNNKGLVAQRTGDYERAETLFLEALAINREHGNRDFEATNLNNLGMCANEVGRTMEALRYYEDAVRMAREIEHEYYLAMFLDNLAIVAADLGKLDRGVELHEESLFLHRKLGNKRGEASTLLNLASTLRSLGQQKQAYENVRIGLAIKKEIGDARGVVFSLENLAASLVELGEPARVVRVLACAQAARESRSMPRTAAQERECVRCLERVRESLTQAEYDQAWAVGCRLSPEEAAEEAVELD